MIDYPMIKYGFTHIRSSIKPINHGQSSTARVTNHLPMVGSRQPIKLKLSAHRFPKRSTAVTEDLALSRGIGSRTFSLGSSFFSHEFRIPRIPIKWDEI